MAITLDGSTGIGTPDITSTAAPALVGTNFTSLPSAQLTGALPAISGASLTGISSVPAGSVVYHAANAAPTGFIKANGATVSRTTYADLFAAIGTTFGNGDGSSTFEVPDLRGEFMRGSDDGRGVDTGRSFGDSQTGQMEEHDHAMINSNNGNGSNGDYITLTRTAGSSRYGLASSNTVANIRKSGLRGTGTETRPRNVNLLACIKF